MKKKQYWYFLVLSNKSQSKLRNMHVSFVLMLVLTLFCIVGCIGFGRFVTLGVSYGIAKFGVYEAQRKNSNLLAKVRFLNKFIDKESNRIDELISFEDRARLKYGMNTISEDVRMAGIGGHPSKEELMVTMLKDPVITRAEAVRESLMVLMHRAELQGNTFSDMVAHVEKQHSVWKQHPSIWPTHGRVTSGFGHRFHPVFGYGMFHEGLDIANKTWTPIFATADGIVKFADIKSQFGKVIEIRHPQSEFKTVYAHLQKIAVTKGQIVQRGELIGYMGSTGRSTGPHLHYEVHHRGKLVNPVHYILPLESVVD